MGTWLLISMRERQQQLCPPGMFFQLSLIGKWIMTQQYVCVLLSQQQYIYIYTQYVTYIWHLSKTSGISFKIQQQLQCCLEKTENTFSLESCWALKQVQRPHLLNSWCYPCLTTRSQLGSLITCRCSQDSEDYLEDAAVWSLMSLYKQALTISSLHLKPVEALWGSKRALLT